MFKIPIVDLRSQYDELRAELRLVIEGVIDSQQFSAPSLIGNGLMNIPPLIMDKSHVFNITLIGAERRDKLKEFLASGKSKPRSTIRCRCTCKNALPS